MKYRAQEGLTTSSLSMCVTELLFFAVLLFDENLAEADEAHPLDEVEMERGDAFWFSAGWYQTVRSCLAST